MEASGLPAIADDSGLMVDALNGAPGVYSARYGGPGLDDAGRYRLLLENMRGVLDRKCRFVSAITLCMPSGDIVTARGECPGTLAYAPQGENGFGYDPIFFVPEKKKTFAQLTAEEKTHLPRGRALSYSRRSCRPIWPGRKRANQTEYKGIYGTDKQAEGQLRGMANSLDPSSTLGKDGRGTTWSSRPATHGGQGAHQVRVLENSCSPPGEAADALAGRPGEVVQVIGTKFVLYRESPTRRKRTKSYWSRTKGVRNNTSAREGSEEEGVFAMKIGVYGGTFDPPHMGHLEAARAAMDLLGLDRMLFIPAAVPPHKVLPPEASAAETGWPWRKQMADGLTL
jgi:non-canonical purine NTP pyrophosphatase (RdgB/HAM1 family)